MINAKQKGKQFDIVKNWNVRGISHELDELKKELINKKLDMAILSETKN